jgi:hypothetical protein
LAFARTIGDNGDSMGIDPRKCYSYESQSGLFAQAQSGLGSLPVD